MKSPRQYLRVWLAALLWVAIARAHDPGISTAEGRLAARELVLVTGFAPADAAQLLQPASRREGSWSQGDFDAVHAELRRVAQRIWEVKAGGAVIAPNDLSVQLLPGDNVSFRLVFPLGRAGDALTLRAPLLAELGDSHRQFVIVTNDEGSVLAKKLLSGRDPVLEIAAAGPPGAPPPPPPSDWAIARGFFQQGVMHLWLGIDHILFLLALLVVCRSFGACVAIITSFTVAHSITLALAALEIVSLPARLVEPIIAASIVYVGLENLLRRGEEPRGRWLLTFAFGLVHGFGFAGVLRELGLGAGAQGLALPLLTFNLGVEAGQIAIAAVVLPLLWWLRKKETFVKRGVPAISAIVSAAGLWWFVERVFL